MKLLGRLSRAGRGAVIPLITVVLAFIVGGLVVLLTGHNRGSAGTSGRSPASISSRPSWRPHR
jgi:ABC-type uncharacterized transport system permease subunit